MKRWLTWAIAIAMLVGAWGIALVMPSSDDAYAAQPVEATVGEEALGRNLRVEVTDLRRAPRIETTRWFGENSDWLVVDMSISSRVEQTILGNPQLILNDKIYSASERAVGSLLDVTLYADIPQSGSLAFELPPETTDETAQLRLSLNTDDRADSVITMDIDLGAIDKEESVTLHPTEWTRW